MMTPNFGAIAFSCDSKLVVSVVAVHPNGIDNLCIQATVNGSTDVVADLDFDSILEVKRTVSADYEPGQSVSVVISLSASAGSVTGRNQLSTVTITADGTDYKYPNTTIPAASICYNTQYQPVISFGVWDQFMPDVEGYRYPPTGFCLYRKTLDDNEFTLLDSFTGNPGTYTDTTALPNTSYRYVLVGVDALGQRRSISIFIAGYVVGKSFMEPYLDLLPRWTAARIDPQDAHSAVVN